MINPKTRIFVERPKLGNNPLFLSISVSDDDARSAVNNLCGYPFITDKSCHCSADKIIDDDKFLGHIVVNQCYSVEEVAQFIEGLLDSD